MVGGFVKRDGTTTGVDNISTINSARALPAWMLRNNGNTAAAGPNVSTTYPFGRYIQDWAYLGDLVKAGGGNYTQGTDFDLNEYNVRWCVTPFRLPKTAKIIGVFQGLPGHTRENKTN